MPFAVAVGLVVAVAWSPSPVAVIVLPVAALFAVMGYVNFRRLVLAPATALSLDLVVGALSWTNLFRHGTLGPATIVGIERVPRQPAQCRIVLLEDAGDPLVFWFSPDHRTGLRLVVEALVAANPAIGTGELFERRLWYGRGEHGGRRAR
jgi:hypothetical protein